MGISMHVDIIFLNKWITFENYLFFGFKPVLTNNDNLKCKKN
jgi:hypothetical protein